MDRMKTSLAASDKQRADAQKALKQFEDKHMKAVGSSSEHKAGLDVALEQMVDAEGPVRKAYMMGRVKISGSEESQGVSAEDHVNILIAKLLMAMKETHERISVANSLVQKCKPESE